MTSPQNIHLPQIQVTGLCVRTINNGAAGKDIKALWDAFFTQNISSRIPGTVSADIYCVYTNYEGDHTGYYDCILGHQTEAGSAIPKGMQQVVIGPSAYLVYTSSGPLPHAVLNTWQHIWDAAPARTYTADFDVYPAGVFQSDNPQVHTYVSVKP